MLKTTLTLTAGCLLTSTAFSQEPKKEEAPAQPAAVAAEKPAEEAEENENAELEALTFENNLIAERHKKETADLRMEIAKLKLEKELFN